MDKFSQVFGYVFAAASIYLAFLFLSKKQFRWSGACVTFAFVAFVLIQLFGNGVFGPHDISTEQIICWLFAAGFLSLAVYFAHKGSLPYAFAIVIMAAFAGFAGLSGVQSFLKTHILWQVTSTLKTYGEKIDQFQTSVLEMRKELTEQQKSLTINQQFLGLLVTNFQNEVKSKQIGFEEAVSKQGKELTVVQFGIQSAQSNVFGQQTEHYGTSDHTTVPRVLAAALMRLTVALWTRNNLATSAKELPASSMVRTSAC